MSYLVLARKWRPRLLNEVVGQDHVVRTLSHALDNERLHHAYLFTGTRGVGKTTLARILAKALNCETGVTSNPCNTCTACTGIDEGQFMDLIEVDAASRTKVEDTRALLENVPYQPTAARYKVYLIDEIHMLSGHSFNALLKTLEEPPSHVKFLLATTDPQKLPITILSRCIQFNLRALDQEEIQGQLEKILSEESVDYELEALTEIARQARGSLRDGLSILDQAISFTSESVKEELVRDMLGMISQDYIYELLQCIAETDAEKVMAVVEKMCQRAVNFPSVLDELLILMHDLALLKFSPTTLKASNKHSARLESLAELLTEEDLQLFYQIGMIGKRDLNLAPDPKSGFEMILLRMLAFTPQIEQPDTDNQQPPQASVKPSKPLPTPETVAKSDSPESPTTSLPQQIKSSDDWLNFVENSKMLSGADSLARSLSFHSADEQELRLASTEQTAVLLKREKNLEELEKSVQNVLKSRVKIKIESESNTNESLGNKEIREHDELVEATIRKIESEPIPALLINEFGGTINRASVQPPNLET